MVSIRLKQLVDEIFQDYKKPAMLLATCYCDWKCLKERDFDISICQNSDLSKQPNIKVTFDSIISRYINNPITHALIIAGLEPMLQFDEVVDFVKKFREVSQDDIVIYTGYYPEEVQSKINILKQYGNIIMKFGRFIPDRPTRYDDVLGVILNSDNQYAVKL